MAVLNSQQPKLKRRQPQSKQASSWDQIKNLVSCKHNPNIPSPIYSSCTRICTSREVVHPIVPEKKTSRRPPSQLRKLSGCYECRTIVDPTKHPMPRATIFSCSHCGEIFPKIESLELHQAVKHAVSELGADDSSRNIVEIIFKSSWLKKENQVCQIQRILKVHNTARTMQRFEEYRDAMKLRARRNARCAADGNELLRFHAATITCALGSHGSTSLCGSTPACGICTIIRHGFRCNKTSGICTTASSGRADAYIGGGCGGGRAMLVCRVIAGRVKPCAEVEGSIDGDQVGGSYDSLSGAYSSNLEELFVFSSRAILPCFVVIYKSPLE